jgi:outer membrane protein TolC
MARGARRSPPAKATPRKEIPIMIVRRAWPIVTAPARGWLLLAALVLLAGDIGMFGMFGMFGTIGTIGTAQAQDDPAAEAALPVLTLRECVTLALEESPRLLTARAEKDIAAENVTSAWGAFMPSVTVSHTYSKSDRTDFDQQSTVNEPVGFESVDGDTYYFFVPTDSTVTADQTTKSTYKDINLSANINLFEGFAKYSRLGSARNSLASREATRRYTVELVIQNVAMAYFNLLLYEELRDVAADTRDQAQQELDRTQTYFRLGSAAKSEVLQQRVRLEQTRLDLVVATNQVEQAFADLAYAMNQPLARRFRVDRSVLETDFQVESVKELYDEALENRLDLKSAEHRLEARKDDVTTATSGYWPQLDLFADYSRYNNESPFRFGSQESKSWRYGYRVTWNVFDRLGTYTERGRAKATARIAEYDLEQARLDAQLEIRQLFNMMVEAREKAKVSEETIEQAQEELRLATERFRVGAGTALDQITAQVNLASARAERVRAVVEFLAAQVQLDRSVGRFSQYSAQVE